MSKDSTISWNFNPVGNKVLESNRSSSPTPAYFSEPDSYEERNEIYQETRRPTFKERFGEAETSSEEFVDSIELNKFGKIKNKTFDGKRGKSKSLLENVRRANLRRSEEGLVGGHRPNVVPNPKPTGDNSKFSR